MSSFDVDVEQLTNQSRELCRLGQHRKAIEILMLDGGEERLTEHEKLQLNRAAARVLFDQGYSSSAKDLLANTLQEVQPEQIQSDQLLKLKIHHHFVATAGCGETTAYESFLPLASVALASCPDPNGAINFEDVCMTAQSKHS